MSSPCRSARRTILTAPETRSTRSPSPTTGPGTPPTTATRSRSKRSSCAADARARPQLDVSGGVEAAADGAPGPQQRDVVGLELNRDVALHQAGAGHEAAPVHHLQTHHRLA